MYNDFLEEVVRKFGLTASAADLRAVALLGFNTPPPVNLPAKAPANRSGLPEGAKAFLAEIEAEVKAAALVQTPQNAAARNQRKVAQEKVEPKKRLALLALLQLVVVIDTQSIGKVMHVLCPCIGVKWATEHRTELQPYELSSVDILKRVYASSA